MGKLTVHSIVRNEPFVYYSIKSVYDAVDTILLYDTGSTDHTLSDIRQLLAEDTANKIIFRQINMDDETQWTKNYGLSRPVIINNSNISMGVLRQQQIDETDTEFFLVLDGDEIYYQKTIEIIRCELDNLMPPNKSVGYIGMDWFVDLSRKFLGGSGSGTSPSPIGRLFRTTGASIVGNYPNEYHSYGGSRITKRDPLSCRIVKRYPPIAHFEIYLKPWRRTVIPSTLEQVSFDQLPEVIVANDSFAKRFEKERSVR